MSPRFDFHTHTLHSDGTLAPAELMARAHASGVEAIAVTDHDVTDGLDEAGAQARALGMRLVPGVEISVTWRAQTLHVVGLGIDPAHAPLQQGLARLREFRRWRAKEIDRRLARKNIVGAYGHVTGLARGSVLSRTHFAHFLVAHGYARTPAEAFRHYLVRGRPGYVPGEWTDLPQAVGWIRAAGGIAVIAHPGRYGLTHAKLRRLIHEFKDSGGRSIEVISGNQRDVEHDRFARIATEHGLLASAGSDYHGPDNPWVDLGKLPPLPAGCASVYPALAAPAAAV